MQRRVAKERAKRSAMLIQLVQVPLPQYESPQQSVPKLGSIFTRKTKDAEDKTRSRTDRKRAVHGAQAELSVDPQPDTTPHELTRKESGAQEDSLQSPATDRVSTLTPTAQPGASATHSRQQDRGPVNRMRKAFMRRRERSTAQAQDGLEGTGAADRHSSYRIGRIRQGIMRRPHRSTSQAPIRVKTTNVAYGWMAPRIATAPIPRTLQQRDDENVPASPGREMAHIDVRRFITPHRSSPAAPIPSANSTTSLNHPGNIEVATLAPSSIASPLPLFAHASLQQSDSFSTAVAHAASCVPSLSTPAVTSTPAPLSVSMDLPRIPPQCPPQEDGLPLLNVLSPEEIRIIQEHRRRNGTSPDFSAGPEDHHQSPVYFGLSTSLPTQFQYSATPSLRVSSHLFSSSQQWSNNGEALDLRTSAGDTIEPELESNAQQDDVPNSAEAAGTFNSCIHLPEFQNPWQ
ncbi:hypothetical protein BU15DRAFT_79535 [Melanogaster broomeanus]|nr:hypothetical protein BU15DRAFT_79535 [Melanogaster broomeanus]